jgi:hypothetical protein
MDAFATLRLPRHAALGEEQVRAAYFALSKEGNVDAGELNEAFDTLLVPESRLKHLLALAAPPEAQAWRTVPMSDELMALFLALGRARPQVEALATRRREAHSALAKALLEKPALALRDQLETIGHAIHERRAAMEAGLAALDAAPDWQALAAQQAQLSYLAKWQAQVRELLLSLM